MEGVGVYRARGAPSGNGSGIFARTLMEELPELPFEEEGRLMDPVLRENFIERVFVYHRWQQMLAGGLTPQSLADFHARHELIVLAHDEPAYRALGRLVAGASRREVAERAARYILKLMEILKKPASRARHTNVLQHLFGLLKKNLTAEDGRELLDLIARYRRGQVPLIVPIILLRHYVHRLPQRYLAEQHYLFPHPDELALRGTM